MPRDSSFYLEDIVESCAKIQRYTQGMDFETFKQNEQVFDAVIRNLEVIGEAAKQLPDTIKAMMPDIEWTMAAKFRDVIAHHYFGLDVEVVWNVVQGKIPAVHDSVAVILQRLQT